MLVLPWAKFKVCALASYPYGESHSTNFDISEGIAIQRGELHGRRTQNGELIEHRKLELYIHLPSACRADMLHVYTKDKK